MKKSTYLWMLPLLFAWPQQMTAQHPLSLPADSITIDSLLETVEKNTPYRVFSTISAPFKVLVKGKASPLQQLKEALEPTPYKLSVSGNNLFVLKEQELITLLPAKLTGEPEKGESYYGDVYTYLSGEPEKASSENKVYNVGDVRIKQPPRKAVLKGQVTNFKTGEPMIGINLILKDPRQQMLRETLLLNFLPDTNKLISKDLTLKIPVDKLCFTVMVHWTSNLKKLRICWTK